MGKAVIGALRQGPTTMGLHSSDGGGGGVSGKLDGHGDMHSGWRGG